MPRSSLDSLKTQIFKIIIVESLRYVIVKDSSKIIQVIFYAL